MGYKFDRQIEYIYFDFDHVLAQRVVKRDNELAKSLGLSDASKLRAFYITGFKSVPELYSIYLSVKNSSDEVDFYKLLFSYYLKINNYQVNERLIDESTRDFITIPFEVYKGVPEALETLSKQFRLGIISNGLPSRHNDIDRSGLKKYFTNIIVSNDLHIEKPDPRIYSIAVDLSKFNPNQIAFIDDEESNVAGAHNFGFGQAILFTETFWV